MRKCWAVMAGVVVATALATPAIADESADAARATAVAACRGRANAKTVTISVTVDGDTSRHRYACSKILAADAGSEVPAVSDFTVGIQVLRKQCFGSAGCTIAYRPKVEYTGSTPLDPSKEYTVVYDVEGAGSPITANVTIRGRRTDAHNATAFTPSKDAKLTAKVTSVLEGSQQAS